MNKSLVVTLLVLMGAAVPWAAIAQDCQYHNAKIDIRTAALIEIEGYEFCLEAKLVGTLKGHYSYCIVPDSFLTSDAVFGDGETLIETGKYDSWIKTNEGDLEMKEWSWFDYDSFVEVGFAKIASGTDAFEGAEGSLAWYPRMPGTGAFLPLEGYICTP